MRGTSQQRQQVLNSTHRLQQGSSVGARYKVARLRLTTLYLYFRCSGRHGVTHPYAIKVSQQKTQCGQQHPKVSLLRPPAHCFVTAHSCQNISEHFYQAQQ
eukprot:m.798666 g.798666  ORF g.798666 m.798666 type:complete len:101 (-) comp23352_c0_seq7:1558-1860(-)